MNNRLLSGVRRLGRTVALVVVLVLTLAGAALAHVKVNPGKVVAGAYQEYNVRVPNEGKTATVRVEVQLPAGITFSSVQPKAGWTYELKRDAAQKVVGLVWSGGQIKPNEYDTFNFMAKNPLDPGTLTFPSIQTYEDGTVVNWTGPVGSEKPAPTVDVVAADTPPDNQAKAGDTKGAPTVGPAPAPAPAPAPTTGGSQLPMVLSGGALLVALIGLGVALLRK